MDVNTRSFAVNNFRSLQEEAGQRAYVAHWNSATDAGIAWEARETVCVDIVAALRARSTCAQIKGMIVTGATTSTTPETVQAWQMAEGLFKEAIACFRFADWPSGDCLPREERKS